MSVDMDVLEESVSDLKMTDREWRITGTPSLYRRCLSKLVRFGPLKLPPLPDTVLLDLYHTMYHENKYLLAQHLADLDTFLRILKANHDRVLVLRYFQAVLDQNVDLPTELSNNFVCRYHCQYAGKDVTVAERDKFIGHGLRLGSFLCEAGWYQMSIYVLSKCTKLCRSSPESAHTIRLTLECCHRLLHAESSYRCFESAAITYNLSMYLLNRTLETSQLKAYGLGKYSEDCESLVDISDLPGGCRFTLCDDEPEKRHPLPEPELNNLILRLFKEFAYLHFLRSEYNESYHWSRKALKALAPNTPSNIVIDVLRICTKAYVMKRKFPQAEILVQQAVVRARNCYGKSHPKYACTLLDYGLYFLNADSILNSVIVYEEALAIFYRIFQRHNIHLAIAHEDLSYALYVHEYSSGRFYKALEHVNKAIKIMEYILPSSHLMLATTKRVKALILEEIALESPPGDNATSLLKESEALHRSALDLSLHAFGEINVQTAKHYGNLGRLYQSMRRFEEAESMQLRAIEIKKQILGHEDFEVGLSLGHLASLYNYHMHLFTQAEDLYYRSIAINLKLFGEEYSGLEYDYIGLINVNTELKRLDRVDIYAQLLHRWREAREFAAERQHPDFGKEVEMPIFDLQCEVFESDKS